MNLSSMDEAAITGKNDMYQGNFEDVQNFLERDKDEHFKAISLEKDNDKVTQTDNSGAKLLRVLDYLDGQVEKFRKSSISLQEKRDNLLLSIDLIKNDDLLQLMTESERDEIEIYIQRIEARLGTVELTVRTVRDASQEDSLFEVNVLIDTMITLGDPVYSRQRCQQYLNACCSSVDSACDGHGSGSDHVGSPHETDIGPVDKKFESVLLGCTLDDQKNIKKRLQALMVYLNKQIVSHSIEANISKSCNKFMEA